MLLASSKINRLNVLLKSLIPTQQIRIVSKIYLFRTQPKYQPYSKEPNTMGIQKCNCYLYKLC